MSSFRTMKEIGKCFGLTSHQLGRILKEKNYRTQEGKPTELAFRYGMVKQKFDDNLNYLWAWNTEKTIELLLEMGLTKKTDFDSSFDSDFAADYPY